MRRRLEIARSLMHQPRILFLDEPTSGLDPASRTAMWEMLRRLKAQTGLTVFLTTHYMDEADQLCDRLAIVDHGRLIALDTPDRLKALVPGTEAIDVAFGTCPLSWTDRLRARPGVRQVDAGGRSCRIESTDRIATVRALLEMAGRHHVEIAALAVRGRTLDDVFLSYTGRDLRDAPDLKARRDYVHLYEHGTKH
jgi:ABC-2 type transport system ATP-binding protein